MIRYNFIFDTVGACVRLGGNEENGRQWGRNNEVRRKAYFLGGGGLSMNNFNLHGLSINFSSMPYFYLYLIKISPCNEQLLSGLWK